MLSFVGKHQELSEEVRTICLSLSLWQQESFRSGILGNAVRRTCVSGGTQCVQQFSSSAQSSEKFSFTLSMPNEF
jgi:hypothetical protein